jgi:hypothetical protein
MALWLCNISDLVSFSYEKEGGFYRKEVEDLRKKLGKVEPDEAEEWHAKNTVCVYNNTIQRVRPVRSFM